MTEGHTERLEAALDGKYLIERKLGEGGMATVYLAQDVKHERKVALKILKPELAAVIGAERFLSEIKTTANLQHPHILALFDSGEASGYLYYVMPYIDGETLRDKLDSEKQLGVEESVRIARDVADALDYAHRQGVIHRDIKPGNILLHDGRPVVADFGIALAVSAAGGGRMTETGLSLGTPHYMSPEQASADRDLSARSDVYSLGCVLYEMIGGQPPHTGPSAQSILVHILTKEATPLTELRHTVPPHVAATVSKAIEKLPADRFETAKQFMEALGDEGFRYAQSPRSGSPAQVPERTPHTASRHGIPVWMAAGVAGIALAGGFGLSALSGPQPVPSPAAMFWLTPDTTYRIVAPCCGRSVAISPRGDRVVYQGMFSDGVVRLYQRPLGQREAIQIAGTEAARHPFFSEDGEWLGFYNPSGLMKVRFDGATPLPVAEMTGRNRGATWGPDGTIVYASLSGLHRVSADGGLVETITEVDSTTEVKWPHFLPDGKTVLVTVRKDSPDGPPDWSIEAVDVESGARVHVLADAADPRYVEPGYLVFSDAAGSIMAQPFDDEGLELSGQRFRITDGATFRADEGQSEYDMSRSGSLVVRIAGNEGGQGRAAVIVDRSGREDMVGLEGVGLSGPRFSPDGRYIAADMGTGGTEDIVVWDRERSNLLRVTFDGDDHSPSWTPDGDRIVFERRGQGAGGYVTARDGIGGVEQVIDRQGDAPVYSPDGRWLLWTAAAPQGQGSRIWFKPTDGSQEAQQLFGTRFSERSPAVSPDGRWIAYVATDDGEDQVYVQSFPEPGARLKVSAQGGRSPAWNRDGTELFYVDYATGDLIAVEVRADQVFDVGEYRNLFRALGEYSSSTDRDWDVHPDGEHFLLLRTESLQSGFTTLVITNALSTGP